MRYEVCVNFNLERRLPISRQEPKSLNININRILPARMDVIGPNNIDGDVLTADIQNRPLHCIDECLVIAINRHGYAVSGRFSSYRSNHLQLRHIPSVMSRHTPKLRLRLSFPSTDYAQRHTTQCDSS